MMYAYAVVLTNWLSGHEHEGSAYDCNSMLGDCSRKVLINAHQHQCCQSTRSRSQK